MDMILKAPPVTAASSFKFFIPLNFLLYQANISYLNQQHNDILRQQLIIA